MQGKSKGGDGKGGEGKGGEGKSKGGKGKKTWLDCDESCNCFDCKMWKEVRDGKGWDKYFRETEVGLNVVTEYHGKKYVTSVEVARKSGEEIEKLFGKGFEAKKGARGGQSEYVFVRDASGCVFRERVYELDHGGCWRHASNPDINKCPACRAIQNERKKTRPPA